MEGDSAIAALISKAGNQTKLAAAVGVTQQAVSNWLYGLRRIPAEHVRRVSEATGVPAHEIRPDIFPAPTGKRKAAL